MRAEAEATMRAEAEAKLKAEMEAAAAAAAALAEQQRQLEQQKREFDKQQAAMTAQARHHHLRYPTPALTTPALATPALTTPAPTVIFRGKMNRGWDMRLTKRLETTVALALNGLMMCRADYSVACRLFYTVPPPSTLRDGRHSHSPLSGGLDCCLIAP